MCQTGLLLLTKTIENIFVILGKNISIFISLTWSTKITTTKT